MSPQLVRKPLFLVLAVLALAMPASAAEVNKYLPEDTEILVSLNIKQILASPVLKQIGLEQIKDALNSVEEINSVLKDLGFDPLKDLDGVLISSPGGNDQDKGLIIIQGQFDLAKFKAKGEQAAKDFAENLKIHKVADGVGGTFIVYEATIQDQPSLFVALANKTTILASPGKDYVVDALKKEAAPNKPVLKSKEFQALLEKIDGNQSLYVAGLGSAFAKGNLPEGIVRDALLKVDAIGGGITVTKDINLEVVVGAKTMMDAKDINKTINEGLTQGATILGLLALQEKKLAPVVDIVRTIRCSTKEKGVTLKAQLTEEALKKLFNPDE